MKKRQFSLMMALVMTASLAIGCSKPESKPESKAAAETAAAAAGETAQQEQAPEEQKEAYRIAVMVKDSTTPFWRYLVSGAKDAGDELGVEVIEYAPMEAQNLDEQVKQVEDAIQAGVDAICIAPVDSDGIVPVLEEANEAGIPVITTNTKANGGKIETFVGVDNYEAAKTLASYMVEQLGGSGNVVIIEGNPAGQTSQDRVKGFEEVIATHPDIKLQVSQPGNFKRDEAMTIMENLIQSNPDIDAVLALNDEMALGAWQALDEAGKADVLVTGFDGALEGLQAILDGKMYASMNQDAFAQGGEAVRAAVEVLNGNTIDEWIRVGGEVCDKDNAQGLIDYFAEHGFQ